VRDLSARIIHQVLRLKLELQNARDHLVFLFLLTLESLFERFSFFFSSLYRRCLSARDVLFIYKRACLSGALFEVERGVTGARGENTTKRRPFLAEARRRFAEARLTLKPGQSCKISILQESNSFVRFELGIEAAGTGIAGTIRAL